MCLWIGAADWYDFCVFSGGVPTIIFLGIQCLTLCNKKEFSLVHIPDLLYVVNNIIAHYYPYRETVISTPSYYKIVIKDNGIKKNISYHHTNNNLHNYANSIMRIA